MDDQVQALSLSKNKKRRYKKQNASGFLLVLAVTVVVAAVVVVVAAAAGVVIVVVVDVVTGVVGRWRGAREYRGVAIDDEEEEETKFLLFTRYYLGAGPWGSHAAGWLNTCCLGEPSRVAAVM